MPGDLATAPRWELVARLLACQGEMTRESADWVETHWKEFHVEQRQVGLVYRGTSCQDSAKTITRSSLRDWFRRRIRTND